MLAAASVGVSLAGCGSNTSSGSGSGTKTTEGATSQSTAIAKTASFGMHTSDTVVASEYVGEVSGTDTLAAFVVIRDRTSNEVTNGMAYFCDGAKVADWFHLTGATGDTLHFESNSGKKFDAKVAGDTVTATVDVGSVAGSVTATKVPPEGDAGLFLADYTIEKGLANDERAGWIVLADGRQKGAIKSSTTITSGSKLAPGSTTVAAGPRNVTLLGLNQAYDTAPWF